MKKLLIWAMMLTSIMYVSCTESEEGDEDKLGSIYGVATDAQTAEPMRAMGVELYRNGSLLLKTVTYEDGHYEFSNLAPDNYVLKVAAEGYTAIEYNVVVEAGRQARQDMQLKSNKGSIAGTVTYAGTNTPVEGAEITLLYIPSVPETIAVVYSDKNGKYEINNIEPQDWYFINARKDDYSAYEDYYGRKLVIKEGEKHQINLELNKFIKSSHVKTLSVSDIYLGNVTFKGSYEFNAYSSSGLCNFGFEYSKTPDLSSEVQTTITSSEIVTYEGWIYGKDEKVFEETVSGLEKGVWYVRAYVQNAYSNEYLGRGEILSFRYVNPILTTLDATNINSSMATLNAIIEDEGNPAYTERGFVYSDVFQYPSVDDAPEATTKMVVSGKSPNYSANIYLLKPATNYFVRAYATTSEGTSYGNSMWFQTLPQ